MKKTITILILLLTVGFLSFSQDIKPISPLFKNLQSPSFSFMIGGNPWIYKGTAFNPTPWTELAGWTNVKDTLNNYFTKSIVQAKIDSLANVKQDTITLTTIGTSGAATFIGSTLNIPQYSGGAEPGHDSLTISAGSTGYFDVNYPQIFSGQKLIDSLDVINTKIAGKEPLLTKGNLTAGSSKVTIGGTGTNALIGSGASIDINEVNLTLSNIGGSVTDSQVPNTITLDNITQIINRSHTSLSNIGTNTHPQIDTFIASKGQNNGLATLDTGGKVPFSQLPASLMIYKGTWSPLTNTPTLADGVGTTGWVYKANLSGTVNFGSGNITFYAGDWVIYNGSIWERSVGTDNVVSVNGQQGIISLNTSHIPENTNLYYTDSRTRAAISLTTTGNSGSATYSNSTGVFNIPTYTLSGLGGEPAFIHKTGFNLDLGTTAGTVLQGRTFGTAANSAVTDFAPAFLGTSNYIPKFGSSGTTIENSNIKYDQKSLSIGTSTRGWDNKNTIVLGDEGSLPTYPFIYAQNSQLLHIGGNAYFDGTFWRYQFELAPVTSYDLEIAYNGITVRRANIGNADEIINWIDVAKFSDTGNFGLGYSTGTEIDNYKLAVNGNAFFNGFTNASAYKLSGVDLFGSLTTGSRTKWDGTKLIDDTDTFAPVFSGTTNYIPKFTGTGTTIGDSPIIVDGLDVLANKALGVSYGYGLILTEKPTYRNVIVPYYTSLNKDAVGIYTPGYDSGAEHVTVLSNGNVGIGYQASFELLNYRLSVNGNALINGYANATAYKLSGVDLFSSLTTNTLEKWDGTKHTSIPNASGYLYNDGTNMSFTSLPSAVTSISAGNGMNFTTITGTGSVTLGTPTTLTASTTNTVTTTSHTHQITGFLPLTGGTLTGAVTSNNSFTGTNFILSSDKRLKQGIRTLTNTDWVERIKFVRYEMKSDPEIERYGVIAQDVEEVNKYLVYTDENGIKSVSYIDLLIAKIANLEKRISELENKKKRHEK